MPALAAALGAADVAAVLVRLSDADERTQINRVKALAATVQDAGAALIVDGHAQLVARAGADGAHLSGIEDFVAAIETLKPQWIAGAGSLTTRHDSMSAADGGADYILAGDLAPAHDFGALRERVDWLAEVLELPCAAFAASIEQVEPLVTAGADFIALDYVWSDPRGPAAATAEAAARLQLPEHAT